VPSQFEVRLTTGCWFVWIVSWTLAPGQSHFQFGGALPVFQPLSCYRYPRIPCTLLGWSSRHLQKPAYLLHLTRICSGIQEQGGGGEERSNPGGHLVNGSPTKKPSPAVQSFPSGLTKPVTVIGASPLRCAFASTTPPAHCSSCAALGSYYLLNSSWNLPKSLPAVLCIPYSVE